MKLSQILATAFVISALPHAVQAQILADTIITNGRIYTVETDQPWAEAFALRDGRFLAVGDLAQVNRHKGPDTKIIDLNGQFVMPGLVEAHAHPIRGQLMEDVDISMSTNPVPTLDEFKTRLRAYADAHPDKEWLFGGVFSWDTFKDEPLNSALIDSIVSDKPVVIEDETGHIVIANSRALEKAGITEETKDPTGGYFGRNDDGSLNGLAYETAIPLIFHDIPNYHEEDVYAASKKIFARFNSLGFTGIRIAQGDELWLNAVKRLDKAGALYMQVDIAPYVVDFYRGFDNQYLFDNRQEYSSEHLSLTSVKIIGDGVPFGQTMWTKEAYPNSDHHGVPTLPPQELERQIIDFTSRGIRVLVHCTGDACSEKVLESLEKSMQINGVQTIREQRNQIAHNVLVDSDNHERMKFANVIMEFGPSFWYPQPIIEQALPELGESIIGRLWPVRQTIDAGVHVAIGSDWNQTWADPFLNTETLVTRRAPGAAPDAKVQNEAGRITREQALYAYTMGGAYALMLDEEMGSIKAGKRASFVVLSQNPLEVPENTIHKTFVRQTWFEGEMVYEGDSKVSF